MAEKNDQDWFDTLAGRTAANADPATAKEAQAVRRAVLTVKPDQDAQEFDIEPGAQKLLFRLHQEGLDGATPKKKIWQLYGAFALAATLVLAVGVVMRQPPPDEDTPIYRGHGAQTIDTADTTKLAATLTSELEAMGIKPKVIRFGATYTISAAWPARPDAKHTAFLKRHSLKQPAGNILAIELSHANSQK